MRKHIARAIAAEIAGDGEPPETVTLFPAGTLETTDGRQPWTLADAAAVVAASAAEIVVDFDHGSSPTRQGSTEAAGWARLEAGPDGEIRAAVSWTPAGTQAIKERRWRYLSPEFIYNGKTREILSIQAVALVNRPGLKYQAERALANEDAGDLVAALAARLGLPAEAGADEIAAHLDEERRADAVALGLDEGAGPAEIAAAKAALGLPADARAAEIAAAREGRAAPDEDPGELVAAFAARLGLPAEAGADEIAAHLDEERRADAVALGLDETAGTAEIAAARAALKAAGYDSSREAERAVGRAVASGHIMPWQRNAALAMATAAPAAFATFTGAEMGRFAYLPRQAAPSGAPPAGAGAVVEEVAAQFKTTPAALMEARRTLEGPSQ